MGTLKILTCTHPNLVQHQKLTLCANFHALCQKSRQISLTAWAKKFDVVSESHWFLYDFAFAFYQDVGEDFYFVVD